MACLSARSPCVCGPAPLRRATARAAPRRTVACVLARADGVATAGVSRRALATPAVLCAAAAALALHLSTPPPALAFGSGFPGYDLNVEAQKRASERTRMERDEQRRLAAEFRAKKAAAAAAATASSAQ